MDLVRNDIARRDLSLGGETLPQQSYPLYTHVVPHNTNPNVLCLSQRAVIVFGDVSFH